MGGDGAQRYDQGEALQCLLIATQNQGGTTAGMLMLSNSRTAATV
jgi:hypothetical protein